MSKNTGKFTHFNNSFETGKMKTTVDYVSYEYGN